MALRPLVVKIHFYHPGGKGKAHPAGAVAHLKYMGAPKKEELVREDEVLRENGADEALIHAKYMGERPGSEGYFGQNPNDPPDLSEMQKALAKHDGPIWRLIVSVAEDDARAMGGDLMHRKAWEDAVRASLPRMASEMDISQDRLRWTAAMHRKEGHPHVHILVWEADPRRQRGKLTTHELTATKRAFVSSLYGPERERLGREKAALRQLLKERGAEAVKEATVTKEPRLSNADRRELIDRLVRIKERLPGTGRLALAYMPADLKAEILDTGDWLLRSDASLWNATQRYADIAGEMAQHYSDNPDAHKSAKDKALTDIRERMASAILRGAVSLDRQAAWREVTSSVWESLRRNGEASPEMARVVQSAVSRLASHPTRSNALDEAKALLAHPDLAGAVQRVAGDRLEQRVAAMLQRNAEYVRDYRVSTVTSMVTGMWQGLMRDAQRLEREAQRIALEEESVRKKRAAEELALQGY